MSVTIKTTETLYDVNALVIYMDENSEVQTIVYKNRLENKSVRGITKEVKVWFESTYPICKLVSVQNITTTPVKFVTVRVFECDAMQLEELARNSDISVNVEIVEK